MARPRKSTGSALATGAEAQVLAARLMSMHADAGLTIAMRMPLLMKGPSATAAASARRPRP